MKLPFVAIAATVLAGCASTPSTAPNLVASVVKAPITPDGDVAGHPVDLVVNFAIDPDPAVRGRTLAAGRKVRVTLPSAFVDTGELPLLDYASDPRCGPQKLACNTAAFLQGWPQQPVSFRKYALSVEGERTLVLTAREDIGPRSTYAPGIKAVHLILPGFRNPAPGRYTVAVEAETGPDGAVERGAGEVEIRPTPRATINVTSVFDQPAELAKVTPPTRASTMHQIAASKSAVPIPYNFLLWNAAGEPMTGVTLAPLIEGDAYALMRDGSEVGRVTVAAPRGARGQRLVVEQPSFTIKAPISSVPAARLRAQFLTGDLPGDYVITFDLHGGNRAQMKVRVADDG